MRLGSRRRARLILYGIASCTILSLVFAYWFALGYPGPDWPTDDYWYRTVTRVVTTEDLKQPLTIVGFKYVYGNLSVDCAYRNMDSFHAVQMRGGVDPKHGFAPRLSLEAKGLWSFGWRRISTSPGARSTPATRVIAPGEACSFTVNLNPYKRLVERYEVARLVTEGGDVASFNLKGFRGGPATRGKNIPSPDDSLMEEVREN